MGALQPLFDEILKGISWTILASIAGAFWQITSTFFKNRQDRKNAQEALELENKKFENEQKKWKEKLSKNIKIYHLKNQMKEHEDLWRHIGLIAGHRFSSGDLDHNTARDLASKIEAWRYSIGGLLASEQMRDAAFNLQHACWNFIERDEASFVKLTHLRNELRDALRKDVLLEDITDAK